MRLLATVTFNPNQLRAHLEPIADLPEVEEIVLVTDRPPPPLPKVRAVVPPAIASRVLGRALAKLVLCCVVGRRFKPDWIIGFNLMPHGLNAILSARLSRARSVYVMIGGPTEWEQGGWLSDNKVLGRLHRPSRRLEGVLLGAARRATVVVTMGTCGRRELLARGFTPAQVEVIPASVDEQRFAPGDVRAEWDVIVVAELIATKRLDDVIEAIARLARARPEVRAVIIGTGPLRDQLQARSRTVGASSNIQFLGYRADVPDLYSRSRIFVLPSRSEGLSIALLEAMASGLPPIVSDVGEARDVVEQGQNGFLYPAGDIEELTRLLALLLNDENLRKQLGNAARTVAVSHAGRVVVAEKYRRLLIQEVVRGPARPQSD